MPTETITATPTATETLVGTPTATLTATPFPPEPPLALLYAETFDNGLLSNWTLANGWALVPSASGQALQVTADDAAASLLNDNLWNVAVHARFQLAGGAATVTLRESVAGGYRVELHADGQVALYRGGQLIGAASASPFIPGTWHVLRVSAIDGVLRVAVDGADVLLIGDDAPLPPGKISFRGSSLAGQPLLLDDVLVWQPALTPEPIQTPVEANTTLHLSGNAGASAGQSFNLLSAPAIYSYNFDAPPTPSTLTATVIDHSQDNNPGDSRPGTVYYAGNTFEYFDRSAWQFVNFPLPSNRAVGGFAHSPTYYTNYPIQLEVLFDLQAPLRLTDYSFFVDHYWTDLYTEVSFRLRLILDTDTEVTNGSLFEGVILDCPYGQACTSPGPFQPVDGVRFVRVIYETYTNWVLAETFYVTLDDFEFTVEEPDICPAGLTPGAPGNAALLQEDPCLPTEMPPFSLNVEVIEVNGIPVAAGTTPVIIPYYDEVKLRISLRNDSTEPMDQWSLQLLGIEVANTPSYSDQGDLPLEQIFVQGLDSNDGGLYSNVDKRVRWNGVTILPGEIITREPIFGARYSGTLVVPYGFTFSSAGQPRIESGEVQVMTVQPTRLDFDGTHAGLKAAIFWALWHELSEGRVVAIDPGPDGNVTIPCREHGWVTNSIQGIDILWMIHDQDPALPECQDNLHFATQILLNGILRLERREYAEDSPVRVDDSSRYVYQYFTGNFVASLGNSPRDKSDEQYLGGPDDPDTGSNNMWMDSLCWPGYVNEQNRGQSYRAALRTGDQAVILNWLEYYLPCKAAIWQSQAENDAKSASLLAFYDLVYASEVGAPSIIDEVIGALSGCAGSYATENYLLCDPTRGGWGMVSANRNLQEPDAVFRTTIPNCTGTDPAAALASTNVYSSFLEHMQEIGAPQYVSTPTVGYLPSTDSILQPVIRLDRTRKGQTDGSYLYPVQACTWETLSYQQAASPFHFPR